MKYALNLAEDGRVLSVTFEKYAPEDAVKVEELPDGNVADYRYVDGEFVYDPLPKPEQPDTPTLEDRVGTLEADTADLAEALDMILNEVTE